MLPRIRPRRAFAPLERTIVFRVLTEDRTGSTINKRSTFARRRVRPTIF